MKPINLDTNEHCVTNGEHCELPQSSHFILWPATEIEPGQLALVRSAEGAEIIGRWFPAVYVAARTAGRLAMNVIIQPGRMVIDPRNEAQVLGVVIPVD